MKRVILESPFRGEGRWPFRIWRTWRNVRYARKCVRHAVLLGESPIASHLLFTQPGVLNDRDPIERGIGIAAGLAWRGVADATVVYVDRGVSSGMRHGIKAARTAEVPVEFRSIEPSHLGNALRNAKQHAEHLRGGGGGDLEMAPDDAARLFL